MKIASKHIELAGIIGALYTALTIALAPISYGPVQVRVAEVMTVLPFLTPWAIPGLYFGCMAANIFGGFRWKPHHTSRCSVNMVFATI